MDATATTTANGKTAPVKGAPAQEQLRVPRPDIRTATFEIVGTSPLICHRWSEKAREMILGKQMKKATAGKVAKDPEADFRASLYPLPDGGYGHPAIAFKDAMVRAGTYLDLKMTFLRGAFHVAGELVPIAGEPRMREDMVRVGMGTADIRYRGEFFPWGASVPILFNANALSHEQLANLLLTAGFSVGVGEWRPEKNGSYGMWRLAE